MFRPVLISVLTCVGLVALAAPAAAGTYSPGRQLRIELTGYSWQDNTPPGSATVSHPVLHARAGGSGTYANPITVAVPGSGSSMEFEAGTRLYLPAVRRYVIVEDSGASDAELPHLDLWIDGRTGTRADTDACMEALTGTTTAVLNPGPGYPVISGPIYSGGTCRIP